MALDGYNGLAQIQVAHFSAAGETPRRWQTLPPMPARVADMRQSFIGNSLFMGIFWITLATALFTGLAAFARATMQLGLPPTEVAFLRNLCALLLLSPLMMRRGADLFATPNLKLYGVRSVFSTISMTAWFCAISLIPLGEVTAISFLAPLFGTLAAIVILGEVVRARRWTALFVGFIGAMIILRPGASPLGMGQAYALLSAGLGGMLAIMVKHLTKSDDADRIVCLTTLVVTPMSLIPALFVWQWPTAQMLPLIGAMGICGVLGHLALTRSFAAMDASLVLTFEFSRLPFMVGVAYLAFGESIDRWTWLGALIIFASAVYITRRETLLRRERAQQAATIVAAPRFGHVPNAATA